MNTDKGNDERFYTESTEEKRRKIWERRLPQRRRERQRQLCWRRGNLVLLPGPVLRDRALRGERGL